MRRTPESLFSSRDLRDLQTSIEQLRRIRTATTTDLEPPMQRFISWWFKIYGPRVPISNYKEKILESPRQQELKDAESIAEATGRFLVAAIRKDSKVEERGALEETIRSTAKYGKYYPSNYSDQSNRNTVERLVTYLLKLDAVGEELLHWHFLHYNMIEMSWSNFNRHEVGVFAPLSTDYLLSKTYQYFMENIIGRDTFEVKPVSVGKNLRHTILPYKEDGTGVFSDKLDIAVFCDTSTFGRTASIVFQAAQEEYPNKKIYGSNGRRNWKNLHLSKAPVDI